MLAILTRLLKFIPGLGGILGKLTGEDSRVQEIKAEAELADIRGFHRTGRISARHAWKYALVAMAFFSDCYILHQDYFSRCRF